MTNKKKKDRAKGINWDSFCAALKASREVSGLSLDSLSEELKVIHSSSLHRIETGGPCDSNHFLLLCSWMNVQPHSFFFDGPNVVYPESSTISKIKSSINYDQTLDPDSKACLGLLMEIGLKKGLQESFSVV